MKANRASSLLCAAWFLNSGAWAGPPHRLMYLENARDKLKVGQEIPTSVWEAVRSESVDASSHPEMLTHIDLAELAKSSTQILEKDFALSTTVDVDVQYYIAVLLERGGDLQSGSGVNYRSVPDEIILRPLLILGNNWIAVSAGLKAKGADARAPKYSVGVKVLGGEPLSDEARAMVAQDAKMRALVPLNARLNVITRRLEELSTMVKQIMERLKAAGKTKVIQDTIRASGITQERLRQLLEL